MLHLMQFIAVFGMLSIAAAQAADPEVQRPVPRAIVLPDYCNTPDAMAVLADNTIITTPAINVLAVIVVLYFLQGLAVLSTVIARQSIAGVLRAGLYIMLLLQPYLAALVAAIGIFDLWGDFRTPRKQENL